MEIAQLQAETRDAGGTRAARRLRRQGMLPGIVYGHGETPENIAVSARDLKNLLDHGSHLLKLKVAGKDRQVLVKDVQFDHMGTNPVHVDFVHVRLDERVRVSVPLEFRGTPIGTQEGGLLEHELVDLEIDCLVTEIPASIRVNVGDLALGQSLHVRDVELPPNINAITSADAIVCAVRAKKAAVEIEAAAVEGEAPAEPEIIGRKEREEEKEKEEKES